MFERYTETARRVIFFARYEGSQSGSSYIETEHLLLGLLRQDKELAHRFLHSHSAVDAIRKQIDSRTAAREKISTSVDMPLSRECKRVLAYAAEEAARLHHEQVATGHLLLGLMREENTLAAEILHERGLRVSSVREELRTSIMPPADKEHLPGKQYLPGPVFTLTAVEPKLRKADPSNAAGFHEDPGADEADPRIGNPGWERLITCQNMTMAHFAESLPRIAPGYIRNGTVTDATGLAGAWDFTLHFSPAGGGLWDVHAGYANAPGAHHRSRASKTSKTEGPISLFEAVEEQLGLKLQGPELPWPVSRPQALPFRFAEVLIRATVLAGKAGASEIGIEILLEALAFEPDPGVSEADALLAAFTGATGEHVSGLQLSDEVKAILAEFDRTITTETLRRALLSARKNEI